jgi:hypothetical protein
MKNSPQIPTSYHPVYRQTKATSGLSDLQQNTKEALLSPNNWGFGDSKLSVKRYKIDKSTWQLTVTNPKTQKIVLQAEGHGDTLFANEDNLARMAEILVQQGLSIRTDFSN